MALLVAMYANKLKVHPEFQRYGNDSVTNYMSEILQGLNHRGSASLSFMLDGKVMAGPYRTFDPKKSGLTDVQSNKGIAMMTKIGYESMKKRDKSIFADGYLKDETGNVNRGNETAIHFGGMLSQLLKDGYHEDAVELANHHFNGCIVKESADGVFGLRTATGYKQLFLIEARDEGNDFAALVSEDSVKNKFINRDSTRGGGEFMGMDVKSRLLGEGELVKIDKDGVHSFISRKDYRTGGEVKARYDPHEPIYGLSNDSTWNGKSVTGLRRQIGRDLYRLYENDLKGADIVGYVPDNPIQMALGFSEASGIRFEEILQKDRYQKKYQQSNYEHIDSHKETSEFFIMSRGMISNKKVVAIDDSIISGSNLRKVSELNEKMSDLRFVSAEIPVVSPEQVGMYSLEIQNDLIANQILLDRDVQSVSDFNRELSRWSGMPVYHNTAGNLSKSLGVDAENLEFPSELRHMVL